jgi:hypothetical protein
MTSEKRKEELLELVNYLTDLMVDKDLRFGQLISNLQSMGINFHSEFNTENRALMEYIEYITGVKYEGKILNRKAKRIR